jgi:ribosomal protein S6--L-glutamate ligase
MRIAILSESINSYSTRRLKEAAQQRGHKGKLLRTLDCSVFLEHEQPVVLYRDKRVRPVDAIIPRIGASITTHGTAIVRQFEEMGIFTLASSRAITMSRDKLQALQLLCRHGVTVPPTAFVRSGEAILPAIERLGGAPVIIKVLEGTQGVGVILADTTEAAHSIVQTLHSARQNVLIQRFVQESRGRDIRAFVVGGQVVAAMRRVARPGEFRSNVHQGGRTESVELTATDRAIAVRAAQILGLRVAGVDLLEAAEGLQVMEVNSSPGLEGIEKTTGVDVAAKIIEHIEDQAVFVDVDIKQRLTLDKGYGVAEFQVHAQSDLAGKTLREAMLAEREVQVLSVQRGGVNFPNPSAETRLEVGDVLLCYGALLSLKGLIPLDRWGRRRKPKRASTTIPPIAEPQAVGESQAVAEPQAAEAHAATEPQAAAEAPVAEGPTVATGEPGQPPPSGDWARAS